jgi:hypothetical protein
MFHKIVYNFTPAELAGIKRRQEEVLRFIKVVAEIRELPTEVMLTQDCTGLYLEVAEEETPQASFKFERTKE